MPSRREIIIPQSGCALRYAGELDKTLDEIFLGRGRMLKLEYILIGKLPKTERDMLLENLRTERECGRNVLEWDSAKKHIQEEKRVEGALAKERLAEKVFAEKAILVSGDAEGTKRGTADRDGCALLSGAGRWKDAEKRGSRRGRWK